MHGELSGIVAPITTPFRNGALAIDQVKENVANYGKTPLAGLFVLGSNGENKHLEETERLQILQATMSARSKHQLIIAGVACESTRQTIAKVKELAGFGVDYISVLTVSYYRRSLTDDVLIRYFTDVAEASPTPILLYNAPAFTGVTLSAGVIEVLSKHPNIAGMKDASPDKFSMYLMSQAEGFALLAGTINTLLPALLLGATGGVVSIANAFPKACHALYAALQRGDIHGARVLYFTLLRLGQLVSGTFGVAGVKYAMEIAGYHGGDPRLPLLPLTESDKERIRQAIVESGVLEVT